MVRIIPIRKPAVLVSREELADLAQGRRVFLVTQVSTVNQPRIKASSRCFGGLSCLPSSELQARGQLTSCRYQGKTVNGSPYLITGSLWGHGHDQPAELAFHPSSVLVQVIGQCLDIGTKSRAMLPL